MACAPRAVGSVFLLQFLGEHHEDAAGAAEVGELVDVLVGGDAAERVTAVSGGNLEGGVDVVDGETDAVHADCVRLDGSTSIASGCTYWNISIRPLPSGVWSTAMSAVLPSRPTAVSAHSPLIRALPSTVRPRSVKKAIAASRSRTVMPTLSSLTGMGRRVAPGTSSPLPGGGGRARPTRGLSR